MFIKEAWFWRGFQSAVFYYISCAPCTKLLDQRKKKQKAARAKTEKAARKAAQAQLEADGAEPQYDHPLPSSTNPFWEEEMKLGPGPPSKRRNNRQGAAGGGGGEGHGKGRESKEKARKKSGSMEMAQRNTAAIGPENGSGTSKGTSSSDTTDGTHPNATEVPQDALHHSSETGWNRRRYQREDELLWGLEIATADQSHNPLGVGSAAAGPPLSRTPSSGRGQGSYYYARNPAVNDLHPPVVSTAPTSRTETQWMLQPPPRAKIMEGKERDNRSRSGTGSTQSSRASSKRAGLGRRLSSKAVDLKTKRGGGEAGGDQSQANTYLSVGGAGMSRSRGSSDQSLPSKTTAPSGQRHDRDPATTRNHPSPNSLQSSRSNSQRRGGAPLPPPISIDTDLSILSSSTSNQARPSLRTIPSTSFVHTSKKQNEKGNQSLTNLPPPAETALLDGIAPTSQQILQELVPPPNQINRANSLNTRTDAPKPKLTAASRREDEESWRFPGVEDGWWQAIPGEDGNGVGVRGGLGHRHRWSMDI